MSKTVFLKISFQVEWKNRKFVDKLKIKHRENEDMTKLVSQIIDKMYPGEKTVSNFTVIAA